MAVAGADEHGHLPPVLASDATIPKHYLALLYDLDQSEVAEDREAPPVAPGGGP